MNRLTGDLSAVREMLGFGAWQIVNIVSGFVTAFAVMFGLSWQLTLIVIAMLPIIVGVLTIWPARSATATGWRRSRTARSPPRRRRTSAARGW